MWPRVTPPKPAGPLPTLHPAPPRAGRRPTPGQGLRVPPRLGGGHHQVLQAETPTTATAWRATSFKPRRDAPARPVTSSSASCVTVTVHESASERPCSTNLSTGAVHLSRRPPSGQMDQEVVQRS